MPMPKSPAETKYVEFSLNQIQAELERKAKENSDTKWRRTVIVVALILGSSFYYGAANIGRGVITPKFREQLSSSWKELKKAISEIRIFRFG